MLPLLWPDIAIGDRKKPALGCLEVRSRLQPSDPPIAFLLIQRHAVVSRFEDGRVESASICIHYQQIKAAELLGSSPASGEFVGSYNSFFNSVSITSTIGSSGAVFLNPKSLCGNRVGTYLMSEIVSWVRQWPDADVNTVELDSLQAEGVNHNRRNLFYENIGLRFCWKDPEHKAGVSFPMKAKDLLVVDSWRENIAEIPLAGFVTRMLDNQQLLSMRLDEAQRALAFRRTELSRMEAQPMRWALKTLYNRFYGTALSLCMVAAVAGLLWMQLGF